MSDRECAACNRATDMFLCWDCTKSLKAKLDSVAWVAPELDITLARLSRVTAPGDRIGGTPEQRLPYSPAASEVAWALHNTLSAWARDLCETRGIDYIPLGYLPPLPPGFQGPIRPGDRHIPADFTDSTAGIAAWLAHHVTAIAMSPGAGECFDEVHESVKAAQRMIDRPRGRLYVGPCDADGCTADLYVSIGKETVQCGACGARHDVQERRDRVQEEVRGVLGTAAELARLLPWMLDSPITRKRIQYYARCGSIIPRTVRGETMYLVGEVIDAHAACEARRSAAA